MTRKNNVDYPISIPFVFIRHGETDWNKQGKIMGHHDIPLNEKGKEQAFLACNKLKLQKIDKIFSSPLSRAYETAKILNSNFNAKVMCIDSLKEWHWGVLEGMIPEKGPEVNSKYYQGKTLKQWTSTPEIIKAEPEDYFVKRVCESLKKVLSSGLFPLVVSHGGVFKAICTILNTEYYHLDNCIPVLFSPQKSNVNDVIKWETQILG